MASRSISDSWRSENARAAMRCVVCGLFGALMACATPPMNLYPMTWVGLMALAWMLVDEAERATGASPLRRVIRLGSLGLAFGFGTNLVALRFASTVVTRFTDLPAVAGPLALATLSAFEATRWLATAVVYAVLARLRVARVLCFAFGVYAGTFVPTMLPWTVACGVCPWPATVQLADSIGERGVSLLMALEAALVVEGGGRWLRSDFRRGWPSLAGGMALLGVCLAYGVVRLGSVDALRAQSPRARVALVAASVSSARDNEHTALSSEVANGIAQRLTELTLLAEREGAELVVWPEAAHPFPMAHVSRHAPTGAEAIVQPGVRGPVLTGIMMTGDLGKYNSAVLATRDGMIAEPYDKVHLMWFGEFVPFADTFPWLRKAFGRGTGFRPGERSVLMEAGSVRAAVLICLEDILPVAGREALGARPNLLVNVTNDAWFEGSAESELHLRLARLRAVETRRDLVRAVNLGPTTWVDAAGRIVAARLASEGSGVLMTEPSLVDAPPTLYAAWGDTPLAVLVAALTALSAVRAPKRARISPQASPSI